MASSSTVQFGGVEVNGPGNSTDIQSNTRFVSGETADGTVFVYQSTSTKYDLWTLRLSELTDTMKNDLQGHFDDTAKGPTNTFTYQHTDGNSYDNCRYEDTSLQWSRNARQWNCTIRIRVPQRVDN